MDSIIIEEEAYIFPPGYHIELCAKEHSNKMTMANGEIRIDIGSRRWKAKISYETATQEICDFIFKIRELSLSFEEIQLCLYSQNSTKEFYYFSIMSAPSFQYKLRQQGLFLYSNLQIELE